MGEAALGALLNVFGRQELSAATADDVILLVVSRGLSDFVKNTLASIEKCGTSHGNICIALPRNALAEVQAAAARWANIRFICLDEICRADYSWIVEYHNFGSNGFAQFTASKWAAIRFLLKSGFQRVTYTDVDVAWIRNPLPMLGQSLQIYDVAIQTEGIDNFPPNYCTGFISIRNSRFALWLLDQVEKCQLDFMKTEPCVHDQMAFNRFMRGATARSANAIQRVFGLSERLFANGAMAEAIVARDSPLSTIVRARIDPMIFHANWTIGTENKRKLLKRTGNWLVD
jgi:hypothetical protein